MSPKLTISAKTLGSLALPDLCPRCFWIQMHLENKLPYQIFPGIFSSIDAYGKRLVHSWFDRHGGSPPWLARLGEIRGYRNPPHYSKFSVFDSETSVVLRGTPDGVLIRADGSHLIVDYKTAKFTAQQDELFPLYEAQLNAYAYIGERAGLSPVTGLALVYAEPVTHEAAVQKDANTTGQGFLMEFSAHILPVELKPELVSRLLRRVREVYDLKRPPKSAQGCEDCRLLQNLFTLASS